jgi:hypothetical protein
MFWKKRTYQHPTLGVFTYSRVRGAWDGVVPAAGDDVLVIGIGGDRDQPNLRHLDMAQRLIAEVNDWRRQALTFLESRQDVREFAEGNGDLVLDGIDVGDDCFDLSFGFTKWPDGYVTVRFVGGKPTDIIMGD